MYKPTICLPTAKPISRGSPGLCGKGALKKSTNPSIQTIRGFLLTAMPSIRGPSSNGTKTWCFRVVPEGN